MQIVLAALVAWIAIIGVAHAQLSADQAGQKRVARIDPRPHCAGDRGGYCYNKYTGEYHCIARADCEYLHSIDHAWDWRTESKF